MSSIDDVSMAMVVERLNEPGGVEKTAAVAMPYTRDRLRETSFARHIVPPEDVVATDCQRSTNHDTLVMLVEIEPRSRAMAVSFRGQPKARIIRAPRYEIPFFTVASEKFQKPEQELLAYRMPLTKVIEENMVKDLEEVEDREFLRHVEACVQALQTETNTSTGVAYNTTNILAGSVNAQAVSVVKGELALQRVTDDFVVQPVQRPDFIRLFNLLDNNFLASDRLLMTQTDFNDLLQWTIEDVGDKIQSETVVEGYMYDKLMGRKLVKTIKTNILRPGNIYCFTAPEFFGKFFVLNKVKFYIDKKAWWITFQCWEDIGMGFGNVAAVRKLELYSGSVRPTATDTGFAARLPVGEEALGAENNRVDAGLVFPTITMF